jgi:hypothetical protein
LAVSRRQAADGRRRTAGQKDVLQLSFSICHFPFLIFIFDCRLITLTAGNYSDCWKKYSDRGKVLDSRNSALIDGKLNDKWKMPGLPPSAPAPAVCLLPPASCLLPPAFCFLPFPLFQIFPL